MNKAWKWILMIVLGIPFTVVLNTYTGLHGILIFLMHLVYSFTILITCFMFEADDEDDNEKEDMPDYHTMKVVVNYKDKDYYLVRPDIDGEYGRYTGQQASIANLINEVIAARFEGKSIEIETSEVE